MKFLRLTYNEIYKQVRKKSFLITLLLIILFCIAFPIINKATGSNEESNYDKYEINYLESTSPNLSNDVENETYKKLRDVRLDYLKLRKKLDISDESYRYALVEENINKEQKIVVIDLINENKDIKSIENAINKSQDYFNLSLDINTLADLNKEQLNKEKENLEKEIEKIDDVIKTDDYSYYINEKINELNTLIKENDNNIKLLNNSKDSKKLDTLKDEEKKLNDELEVYEYLKEKNVKNSEDFRAKEANDLINNIESYYAPSMSESELANSGSALKYEDYKELSKKQKQAYKDEIDKSWYSIKHNENFDGSGAKTSLNSSFGIISFLCILSVVIAGSIVSSEFSKGTIRLLVIRPNKRWKILLSKFLAMIIVTLISVLITIGVCIIANGIVYGFEDYLVNSLVINNGQITEVNFIIYSIKQALILSIPVFFVGTLAFMLSTITNNTALSVGIGIFVMFGSTLVLQILMLLKIPFVDLTFIPYLMYNIFSDPLTTIDTSMQFGMILDITKANIVLLIWAIAFYILSNIVFIKKDIKN